ncbi:hypothetical protein JJ685_08190 [Ramlibacter monticola]|uniref:Uncharacterized protein n=1 Tax=Ramlibacter monticola TaxID=1926872 RepID=A0A936YXG4_9BURK|nr:hypothetical protein [Ramlibacter monticola]
MLAHPVLINRPIVVTALGAKLCRPSGAVHELLPSGPLAPFVKEDGEVVIRHRIQVASGEVLAEAAAMASLRSMDSTATLLKKHRKPRGTAWCLRCQDAR